MYYKELSILIEKILYGKIEKESIEEYLIDSFDYEAIYNSDDILLTDTFFTLIHYASGEERINNTEWVYLNDCLLGKRKYSIDEKINTLLRKKEKDDN